MGNLLRRRRILRPISSGSVPPAPTSGQTLVWRATTTQTHSTIESGSPANFDTVSGTVYQRKSGPRYGTSRTDESWQSGGYSLRVPYRQLVSGTPTTIFNGAKSATSISLGMAVAVVNVSGAVAGTNTRILQMTGYPGDATAPLWGVTVKAVSSTGSDIVLSMWDSGDSGKAAATATTITNGYNRDIYLVLSWNHENLGGGNYRLTYRVHYALAGATSTTLIGTSTANAPFSFQPQKLNVKAVYNDLGTVDPWWGSIGAISLYSATSLATTEIVPADIVLKTSAATWYVDQNAAGGGNGYSLSAAFTPDEAYEESRRETFKGSYLGYANNGTKMAVPTTTAEGNTIQSNIDAGTAWCYGDTIIGSGPVEMNYPMVLENTPGVRVGGSWTSVEDISGEACSRPDSGTYPNVWCYEKPDRYSSNISGAGVASSLMQVNQILFQHVAAANLAAALPLLTAGKCWANTDGIYFYSDTDPDTDAKERFVFKVLPSANGTTHALFAIKVGQILPGTVIEGGAIVKQSDGTDIAQYCVGVANPGCIASIEGTLLRGAKHALGCVGSGATGFCYDKNLTISLFPVVGGGTPSVWYTSATSAFLACRSKGFSEPLVHYAGENYSDNTGHATIYAHGTGAYQLFDVVIADGTCLGSINLAQCIGATATITNTTAASISVA